jgi:hypothetical protein
MLTFTRSDHISAARTYLHEAAVRRNSPYAHQRRFGWMLLNWAANARRKAMASPRQPVQGGLF